MSVVALHPDGGSEWAPCPDNLAGLVFALGLVSHRQLLDLDAERTDEKSLGTMLVRRKLLSNAELADALALREAWSKGVTLWDLTSPAVLALLPPAFALKHQVLPVRWIGRRLLIALSTDDGNPPMQLLDECALLCGHDVIGLQVAQPALREACHHFYDPHSANGAISRALASDTHLLAPSVPSSNARPLDAPVADLVDDLVVQAITSNASDIHLAPEEHVLRVRLRIDGVLRDLMAVPKELESALISRIKLVAGLNIAERRHPQDGRIGWAHDGQFIDLRVAVAPTRWGELVVIRLLQRPSNTGDLAVLGLEPAPLSRFQHMMQAPNGIVLVTGPTGSGKSTTLYATLQTMDRVASHVISIEDPIEFSIDRVMQIQVLPAIGLTFAAALRSILRLDPNVIFVGEIRDEETMAIALHAALTGHLVISTLHANSAVTAIDRMVELGATPTQAASALRGVVAQRLVRKLCAACRSPLCLADRFGAWAEATLGNLTGLFAPRGCDACDHTGYRGRLALIEVMPVGDDIARAVAEAMPAPALLQLVESKGMTSLLLDGLAKAKSGLTSLAEVDRVIQLPTLPDCAERLARVAS